MAILTILSTAPFIYICQILLLSMSVCQAPFHSVVGDPYSGREMRKRTRCCEARRANEAAKLTFFVTRSLLTVAVGLQIMSATSVSNEVEHRKRHEA